MQHWNISEEMLQLSTYMDNNDSVKTKKKKENTRNQFGM